MVIRTIKAHCARWGNGTTEGSSTEEWFMQWSSSLNQVKKTQAHNHMFLWEEDLSRSLGSLWWSCIRKSEMPNDCTSCIYLYVFFMPQMYAPFWGIIFQLLKWLHQIIPHSSFHQIMTFTELFKIYFCLYQGHYNNVSHCI